jgi:phosphatidylglycerol lysyltransferase
MVLSLKNKSLTSSRTSHAAGLISILIGVNGLYILTSTLIEQVAVHRGSHLTDLQVDLPLLLGLSVLYLSTLLRRRKRTAWAVTILAYTFYFAFGLTQLLNRSSLTHETHLHLVLRVIVFPCIIVALLIGFQHEFVVKSDIQGFGVAARFSAIILIVALLYGVIGFQLLDQSDFHQEINLPSAIHYTIDQFNITTEKPLKPYTKRAHLFVDSLSVVSFGAVVYAVLSLFQPIRARFSDQTAPRGLMLSLMERYGAPSEEFFKLWPHDKLYFFDRSGQAGLAFHSYQGVALCVSDPVGDPMHFGSLLGDFQNLCFSNDWLPAFIHVSDQHRHLYQRHGFTLQKLGQEAVVNLEAFQTNVAPNKYFRQIRNKFQKQGYSCELLQPPHHSAVLNRLKVISDDWLSQGGRAERGFAMGYYTTEYMQQCQLLVARDAAGTIQAFVNVVPASFDKEEATYDLLRNAEGSLGNINDYLLMNLIDEMRQKGYQRLNLGLAPLGGLQESSDEERSLIDNLLQFAYANGDRFYSFSGLFRFKAKYEPQWQDRFVAYQGGMGGFSRTMTALTRCMRRVVKHPH